MASADFSRFVVTACPCGFALETSPVMDVFFPSYTRLIYSESSEQLLDFVLFCRLIRSLKPWYQVSVRRVRCLPTASFRFHLTMDTLAFGCSLPAVRAAWGLAPVRIRSCWANNKKPWPCWSGFSLREGGDLLSHSVCSIIGAAGLNFSVRNGKRCAPAQ